MSSIALDVGSILRPTSYHFAIAAWRAKRLNATSVKRYSEIIANNLKKAGWSLGWVSVVDSQGRTLWVAEAHRGDGKRFIVRADEKLTTFVELESAILNYQFLEARIVPERIEHRIEPEQRWSERHPRSQRALGRYR